jgi:hypothetical protein
MRAFPITAITLVVVFLSSAAQADGTWCAQLGTRGGATNCGFYSFEQCMATASGNGGFCQRNPFSLGKAGSAYGYAAGPRKRYRRD